MISNLRQRINPGLRGAMFYAIYWGAVGSFEPFLSLYYLKNGLTDTQIGWMAAVLPLCTLLINPLIARLADRTRRRVTILSVTTIGYALALTVPALIGSPLTFPLLLGLFSLISIFRSPVNPLADSLIAGMASRYQLDFGHMRLWGSFLFTVTAVSLGAVWQRAGFNAMFFSAAGAFLLVILATRLLEEPLPFAAPLAPVASPKGSPAKKSLDPSLLFLLGATFLILAAVFMTGTFGAVYINGLGGSPALVGAMMGFAAMGEVPGMLFGSRIGRRMGDTNLLILSYAITAIGLVGYTVSPLPAAQLAFAVLRGVGFGALLVNTVTILNNRAPRELASTYQGILSAACWGLAPLLGGPFSGWVYQTFGPMALFWTAAGMAVAGGLLLLPTYRLWRKVP